MSFARFCTFPSANSVRFFSPLSVHLYTCAVAREDRYYRTRAISFRPTSNRYLGSSARDFFPAPEDDHGSARARDVTSDFRKIGHCLVRSIGDDRANDRSTFRSSARIGTIEWPNFLAARSYFCDSPIILTRISLSSVSPYIRAVAVCTDDDGHDRVGPLPANCSFRPVSNLFLGPFAREFFSRPEVGGYCITRARMTSRPVFGRSFTLVFIHRRTIERPIFRYVRSILCSSTPFDTYDSLYFFSFLRTTPYSLAVIHFLASDALFCS